MHHENLPCACANLREASRILTRLYDAALEPFRITVTQFSLLRKLARYGDMPLVRLAERMGMDRTTLYRTIAPVERAGWVRIEAANGRTKVAQLTGEGRDIAEAASPAWEEVQGRIYGALGETGWKNMVRLVDDLRGVELGGVETA